MTTEARKKARHRALQRAGLGVGRIRFCVYDVAEALIRSGRATPAQCLERRVVEHEIELLVHEWTKAWLRD
jgi:hypothetical protein